MTIAPDAQAGTFSLALKMAGENFPQSLLGFQGSAGHSSQGRDESRCQKQMESESYGSHKELLLAFAGIIDISM